MSDTAYKVENYFRLHQNEFDAIVTGEVAHYALWFEYELIAIISDYFVNPLKQDDFNRIVLRREALTFSAKVDIVRSMKSLCLSEQYIKRFDDVLLRLSDFIQTRNSLAHGICVTPKNLERLEIHIEVISRGGNQKKVVITPESHVAMMMEAESIFKEIQDLRQKMFA